MSEEWLKERQKGIGGSDAAAVCGVSPYQTPLQIWQDKKGLSGVREDNSAMEWGRILEPVVRQRYSDVTGRTVKIPQGILIHPQYPFILGNIDGFTGDDRLLEIKTAYSPKDWGEEGTDEIPLIYMFQVQHYLSITALPVADIAVLIGGRDFRIYEVPSDPDLQGMIIEKEAAFWKLVEENIPPPPMNYEDAVRLFRKSEAKSVTATLKVEGEIIKLRSLREQIAFLKTEEEKAKAEVFNFMQNADTLLGIEGNRLATWKSQHKKAYTVKESDSRVFLLKENANEK